MSRKALASRYLAAVTFHAAGMRSGTSTSGNRRPHPTRSRRRIYRVTGPTLFFTPTAHTAEGCHESWPDELTCARHDHCHQRQRFHPSGPDLAFNSISILKKGQTVATGRDVLARWSRSECLGIRSERLDHGRDQLYGCERRCPGPPEVEQTVGLSWLRSGNCTHHLMTTDPGRIDIPPVDATSR
jgi:hypothetical protein